MYILSILDSFGGLALTEARFLAGMMIGLGHATLAVVLNFVWPEALNGCYSDV